jgi:hypothetical protein
MKSTADKKSLQSRSQQRSPGATTSRSKSSSATSQRDNQRNAGRKQDGYEQRSDDSPGRRQDQRGAEREDFRSSFDSPRSNQRREFSDEERNWRNENNRYQADRSRDDESSRHYRDAPSFGSHSDRDRSSRPPSSYDEYARYVGNRDERDERSGFNSRGDYRGRDDRDYRPEYRSYGRNDDYYRNEPGRFERDDRRDVGPSRYYDRGDSRAQPGHYHPYPEQPRDYDREEYRGADRGYSKRDYYPEGGYGSQPIAHGNEVSPQHRYRADDNRPSFPWRDERYERPELPSGRSRSGAGRGTRSQSSSGRKRSAK